MKASCSVCLAITLHTRAKVTVEHHPVVVYPASPSQRYLSPGETLITCTICGNVVPPEEFEIRGLK